MKKLNIISTLGLLFACLSIHAQNMPECFAIAEMEMDPVIHEVAIENSYSKVHQAIKKEFTGYNFFLLKGIRGERPDKYAIAMCFDLIEFRDFYYPSEGGGLSKNGQDKWRRTGLVQGMPFVKETKRHTDYTMVGFDQLVNPQLGEVIAIRYPEIKPDLVAEFESRLLNDWLEDLHKGMEGLHIYWLKADRGERTGKYMMLLVFDTYERYRKYWTDEGQSTAAYNKAVEPYLQDIEDMSTYFVDETFDLYTDYIKLDW